MKKLLCMLLVLVMVLSLAACADFGFGTDSGKDRDEEEEKVVELKEGIVGTWTVKITFTEEQLGFEGINIEDVPMSFSFDEDGEVSIHYSDEDFEIFKSKALEAMEELLYAQFEGYTHSEVDELFEDYYGMSVSEYMQETLENEAFLDILANAKESYDYEVDGDLLIIDGIEMTGEIEDNKLIISDCEDELFWESFTLELPVVMERAD